MAFYKQIMRKEPLKRFLIQCVAKSGSTPEPLPTELELCARFKVSRVTAHRAVEDLLASGYVIHLPRRRGIFTNPDYANRISHTLGIVGPMGNCSCIYAWDMIILRNFLTVLEERGLIYSYSFLTLDASPESVDEELMNSGLDGVLWLCPETVYAPALNRLVAAKFPIVFRLFSSNYEIYSGNFLSIDYNYQALCRYQYFEERNCRKLVFCGANSFIFNRIEHFAAGNGKMECRRLTNPKEILSDLPELLKRWGADSILCECENGLPEAAFMIVAQNCKKFPQILLGNKWDSEKVIEKYPDIKADFLYEKPDRKAFIKMGRRAGIMMKKMLNKRQRLAGEFFKWAFNPDIKLKQDKEK